MMKINSFLQIYDNLVLINCRRYFAIKASSSSSSSSSSAAENRTKRKQFGVSNDIFKYYEMRDNTIYLKLFPGNFFNRKRNPPSGYYIADPEAAREIFKHFTKDLQRGTVIAEVNPGPGLLTKNLLDTKYTEFILFEPMEHFIPQLEKISQDVSDRVHIKKIDVPNLWKLDFQDKLDNGTRVSEALEHVPKRNFNDDINMRIFIPTGSLNFIKHLFNSIISERSLLSYGRCEMFIALPPHLFIQLTCSSEAGYLLYRANSVLFQIMFEYKFLMKIPKKYFLPWQVEYDMEQSKKLKKIYCIDPEFLYLVKIVPRRELYNLCAAEDMPALWYFIRQNFTSRKARIIPNFEKLIPGCGPRLIVNLRKPIHVQQLYPEQEIDQIPKYSKFCTTMSNEDYFPNMNIFTQFGDLKPSQILSLFCQFRNWPEYKECSFLTLLENSLLKSENLETDTIDTVVDIHENEPPPPEVLVKKNPNKIIKTEQEK